MAVTPPVPADMGVYLESPDLERRASNLHKTNERNKRTGYLWKNTRSFSVIKPKEEATTFYTLFGDYTIESLMEERIKKISFKFDPGWYKCVLLRVRPHSLPVTLLIRERIAAIHLSIFPALTL